MMTAPTTMIAMMMAMIPGSRYRSAAVVTVVVVGDVVDAGMSKFMWVCADEVKYAFDPANVAVIAYVPGTGGV